MLKTLLYNPDSSTLFRHLAQLPWAAFLDSGFPHGQLGRFDILTAYPHTTLITHGLTTEIKTADKIQLSTENPLDLLRAQLNLNKAKHTISNLPFCGGAIGYFAYDLARRFEILPTISLQDINVPEMAVGIYDWAIIVDHLKKETVLFQLNNHAETADICDEIITRLNQALNSTDDLTVKLQSNIQSNFTEKTYAAAFARIQEYLRAGDCYQINLAQRFSADIEGSPWQLYQQLRKYNPAPYSAFFNTPNVAILSLSPERFLQVRNNFVETKPIKGTQPRNHDSEQDQKNAALLLNSIKDRAENIMIVDLLRNDIGKNCRIGSVQVPKLCALESFPAVHHLVSTVTGELAANKDCIDLLQGCFPGGSITGAPKLRAMEIIEELEPHRRNVYCGSVGYINYNGNMDTNIAIRTLMLAQEKIHFYAGGGITIDSILDDEYAETFAKIKIILQFFKTL